MPHAWSLQSEWQLAPCKADADIAIRFRVRHSRRTGRQLRVSGTTCRELVATGQSSIAAADTSCLHSQVLTTGASEQA